MRLLLVHPHPDLPSSRIRVLQVADALRERGVACEVELHPGSWRAGRALAKRAAGFDAVVMHYKLPSVRDGLWWGAIDVPLVFDFDDAIRYRPHPKNGSYESGTRRRRFARALGAADAFACGNAYLAALAEPAGKPIKIVPSAVPVDVPRRDHGAPGAPGSPGGPLRIGWVGSSGNAPSLEPIHAALAAVARHHDVVLSVISDRPHDVPGCPVEHVPWTLEGQGAALARLDVGIMPLQDNAWNRGKCSYKLLQYMAAGVPAVGSPVGMNAEVIVDGENGRLPRGRGEWIEVLDELLGDAGERARLGAAGRATVEARFSYAAVTELWLEFLAEITEL